MMEEWVAPIDVATIYSAGWADFASIDGLHLHLESYAKVLLYAMRRSASKSPRKAILAETINDNEGA